VGALRLYAAARSAISIVSIHDTVFVTALDRVSAERLARQANAVPPPRTGEELEAVIDQIVAVAPTEHVTQQRHFLKVVLSVQSGSRTPLMAKARCHRPGGGVREEELDRAVAAASETLRGIDEKLARGLPNVSPETRYQWAILKAAAGDRGGVYQLLRDLVQAPSAFPDASLRAVMALARQ
jgi:hypothetical protein